MSTDLHGPILGRRRLSAALRQARDSTGATQEQVAAAMDWSLSKLIRIEKGTVGISTTDLRSLLAHYGIHDGERINGLVRLAKTSRERPWWATYREHLPSGGDFEKLLGLEAEASKIETFQMTMMPGLLQTRAYIRYVLGGITHKMETSEAVNVREEVRIRRQEAVIHSDAAAEFRFVIDEGVLRRVADSGATMREQLLHLAQLSARPNVTIEVIPFAAGPYVDSGTFTILSFGSADPPVVYLENAWYDQIIDRTDQVTKYKTLFELLHERALNTSDSDALIRKVADDFR
jgi:transcriptional regulator with XRE-family HTH domain